MLLEFVLICTRFIYVFLQVFDYLVNSAACNQSREVIKEFWKRTDVFELATAEKLSIVNTRPSSGAELFPVRSLY